LWRSATNYSAVVAMAGRPRKAEPEVALDAAIKAFWARGYQATSMTDLTEATGLHKASLYQTFGDKRSLFFTALESYANATLLMLKTCKQENPDPIAALVAASSALIQQCSDGKGCLAVNSLVEVAPIDTDVEKLLNQFRQRLDNYFASLIEQGKSSGQIGRKIEAKPAARLLAVFLFGITTNMAAGMSANKARKLSLEQIRLVLQLTRKQVGVK
jgi:TetR/AcrR family transcriptional repressor of nem operon